MDAQEEVRTLIHRINARLGEAAAADELHAMLTSGDMAEVSRLATLLDRAGPEQIDISLAANALHLLGTLRWYRHQLVAEGKQDGNRRDAVDYFVVPYVLGLDDIPEPLLPDLANRALPNATAIHQSAVRTGARDQVDQAVLLWRRLAGHLAAGHPGHAGINANVGSLLLLRFEGDGSADDLNQAVEALETALAGAVDVAQREGVRPTLVRALRRRSTDLDRVIDLCADGAAATTAPDETYARWLSGLADSLMERYERTRATADLDRAIDAARSSLAVDPTPSTSLRYTLAWALAHRFGRTGSAVDQTEAIDTARTVMDTTTPDDPYREPTRKVLEAMLPS